MAYVIVESRYPWTIRWTEDDGYSAEVLNWLGKRFDDYSIPLDDDDVETFNGDEVKPGVYEDQDARITPAAEAKIRAKLPAPNVTRVDRDTVAKLKAANARIMGGESTRYGSRYYTVRRADGATAQVRFSDHREGGSWAGDFTVYTDDPETGWGRVIAWVKERK